MDTNYDDWSDAAVAFEVMCRHLNPIEKKIEKGVAMYRTHEEEKWREFNIDNPAHVWPIMLDSGISINHGKKNLNIQDYYEYDPLKDEWVDIWFVGAGIPEAQGRTIDKSKILRVVSICFLKLTDATND